MHLNIELVVINKAPGLMQALVYRGFNITLFMGEENFGVLQTDKLSASRSSAIMSMDFLLR